MCYYLPLTYGLEYASGLTIYCALDRLNNIRGIVSHGSPTRVLGRRDGTPCHMPLYPGEYINSVWLYLTGSGLIIRDHYSIHVRLYTILRC